MFDYRSVSNRDLPIDVKACASKVAFTTRAEARFVAMHGRRASGDLHPYHCLRCDAWHLGHRRRRGRPGTVSAA